MFSATICSAWAVCSREWRWRVQSEMTTLPTLDTARLRLRPYSEADIGELLPLIGTREVAATTLRIAHPYTEQDARDFLALARSGWRSRCAAMSARLAASDCASTINTSTPNWATGWESRTGDEAMRPRLRGKCCATDSKLLACIASMHRISSTIRPPAE